MSNHTLTSWKDCRDPRRVRSFALEHGCQVRTGKGDHEVITYQNRSMPFYNREISTGVACKLWKWFKIMGLLAIAIAAFLLAAGVI
jgi:hypothetical protein